MNPIFGRYRKTKNLKSNINLPPPLMSRFDIFFVLTDECNEIIDTALAKKIVEMHRNGPKILEDSDNNVLTNASLLRYMRFAKVINPKISPRASKKLAEVYCRMRMAEFNLQKSSY